MFPTWSTEAVDTVVGLVNPITRFTVRLDPPYKVEKFGDLDTLMVEFNKFCMTAWDAETEVGGVVPIRRNPAVVNPYDLLAGTVRLVDLDTVLGDLVHEYGYYYVHSRLCELDPMPQGCVDAAEPELVS